jgi:uncharacterized protein (DUF1330 family)
VTVYAIGQLRIHDRAAYDRYAARFMDVLKPFGGRLLASDEAPQVFEGDWAWQKLVILSFPDEAAFTAWANSPAYVEIAKDRKAGAEAVVLMARGVG